MLEFTSWTAVLVTFRERGQGRGCNRVELKFCSFSDNSGVNGGPCPLSVWRKCLLRIANSRKLNGRDGGAICLVDCTIATIYRSWLIDNVALNRGGAVFVDNVIDLEMLTTLSAGTSVFRRGWYSFPEHRNVACGQPADHSYERGELHDF